MEDEEIVALFWERSEEAIGAVDEKYGGVLRRIGRNILNSDRDGEECVNDAYLAAWNTIPPQRPEPLLTYLCKIVRNQAVARYHANTAQKRNSSYDVALEELEECLASDGTVEEALSAKELTAHLDRFLDTLDGESRALFVRRYWYADSIAGLAEQFRLSKNNVSVRLSRLREKLRRYLKKEGYDL